MKKRFYCLFIFFSLFLMVVGAVFLRKDYSLLKAILLENNVFFISGKVKNKTTFNDDELKVKIDNVAGVRKEVYIYQWVEEKKYLKKYDKFIYRYEKKWVNGIVDSSKFKDKSKSNFTNKNVYTNKELKLDYLVIGSEHLEDYFLDNIYYNKKIKFENLLFDVAKVKGKVINKEFTGKYEATETFADLDSYVSVKNKIFAKNEVENFRVIDGYILYNGKDFYNPEIGDTKIIYKIFAPDFISFVGAVNGNKLKDYRGFALVNFDNRDKESILLKEKLKFIVGLFLFINFSIFLINKIFFFLRKDEMRNTALKHIIYFNEYIIFSKNHKLDVILIFMIIMGFILELYYLIFMATIVLVCLRNVDYYSI